MPNDLESFSTETANNGGSNETCTTTATKTGAYFVMLRGYTAYSGVTLKASY